MKIAIVDNQTRYLTSLVQFAEDNSYNEVRVFRFDKFDQTELNKFDLIILSGGYKDPVSLNPEKYQKELDFVKSTGKPVLGICMGFEIIAYAFGSELVRMHNKQSENLELKILNPLPVTNVIRSIKVPEHHRWHVKNLGSELLPIAESKDGIEIFKHKIKPIYGFQFHPELNSQISADLLKSLE